MPPEDELADEVPLRDENDSAEAEAEPSQNPADSGVDFAVGGAPDDDSQFQDYDGPTEDLSGELADDAGAEASYGYDTAAETARFEPDRQELSDLTDNAATPDDSDQYKLSQSDPEGSQASFADDAGAAPSEDATYEPAPAAEEDPGYSSHHPDMQSEVGAVAEEAPAEEPAVAEEAPVVEATPEPEPEPEPAPPPKPARASAPPKPSRPAPAPEPVDSGPKPGQVRKSAIDEMFARAAELKNKKSR